MVSYFQSEKRRLVLIILAILPTVYINSPSSSAVSQSPNPVQKIQAYHGGQLNIVEGVKFLKLRGSYYEMGKQYGFLMQTDIKAMIAFKKVASYIKKRSRLSTNFIKKCTPKRYLDFMVGMSDGSGVSFNEIFWVNFTPVMHGCSSILVKINHHLLHGQNQDHLIPSRFKILVEFNPEKQYRYIVSTYVGTCDVLEGMNEKGITLTQNDREGPAHDITSPSLRYMFPTFKFREILESAATLGEIDALLKGYLSDLGGILIVGSNSEKDGAIYDLPYGNIKKNRFNGKDYLFATNSYVNATLHDHPEKCLRYQIIARHLKSKPVVSVNDIIDILADPGTSYGVNNIITIHSIIFDPQNAQIYFTIAPQYAAWGKWLRYDWKKDLVMVYRPQNDQKPPAVCSRVSLQKIAAMKTASIRDIIPSGDDQVRLWDELSAYLKQNDIVSTAPGFTIYYNNNKENTELEVVQPVANFGQDTRRVKFTTLNATEMACVTLNGPYEGLDVAFYTLYQWTAEKGVQTTANRRVIWVKGAWNEKNPGKWVTEVQIPIKR